MPLTDFPPQFSPPSDLHVVRGQGPVFLGRLLRVNWNETQEELELQLYSFEHYAARYSDVEMRFHPTFNYAIAGNEYVGFGIRLNRLTGELNVGSWSTSSHAPANFIVEATVANNGTGLPGHHFPVALLRVQVHRGVEQIWLTPRKISIRQPEAEFEKRYAFTVRASFDDQTVGDITYSDELEMLPSELFQRVRGGEPEIALTDAHPIGLLDVTARTSVAWGSRQAQGQINVLKPWSTATDLPKAELIEGHPKVLDGTIGPEEVPNVLFVSCGFSDDEADAFRQITDILVRRLTTDPMLQPYGHLARSMNYWRLMILGQDGGVSVRCEVLSVEDEGQWFATPLPSAVWPAGTGPWGLGHLLYMAGLPTRADLKLVRDKATNQPVQSIEDLNGRPADDFDFTALSQKWNAVMYPIPARNVLTTVAMQWLKLAARTFIDEVNNFPATSIGHPPAASIEEGGSLSSHSFREGMSDVAYRMMPHVVAAPRGNAPAIVIKSVPDAKLGTLWREWDAYAFRNREFMVAVHNVSFGRANVGNVRLYLSSRDQTGELAAFTVEPVSGRDALRMVPLPPTRILRADTWRVLAHELGHAFGLGDEYVEQPVEFTGSEADLRDSGNLCTVDAIFANGNILIPEIKWNWHRIRFASVIKKLEPLGPDNRFKLRVNPQRWFLANDIVFVRSRTKNETINRNTATSAPFLVQSVSAAGDELVVAPTQPNTGLAGFRDGSIVYKPVPGLSSGQFLRLVSPAAARIMQIAIKGTMTGTVCNPGQQASKGGGFTQTPVESDPLGRVKSKDLPRLIGAYFGGQQIACGIVHPAGQCMMRDSHDDTTGFCAVCRYVMVETVDPERHDLIDRDYEKQYPR